MTCRRRPAAFVALAFALSAAPGCGDDDDDVVTDAALIDAEPADSAASDAATAIVHTVLDNARISSDSSQPNFHRVSGAINWGAGPFRDVRLVVDLATTCYPFESWTTPPSGQRWPADCDAFDRNFEITLDDPQSADAPPAIELIRAITPFGGPLHLEADITDVANGLRGAHRIQAFIATWSDGAGQVSGSNGGWNVTVRVLASPGPAPRNVLAVVPLWNGSQGELAGPGSLAFTAPPGTVGGKIEYRVTGHGGATAPAGTGCIGPAEEFCRRTHELSVDGVKVREFDAWRSNCAALCTIKHQGPASGGFDYCLENPCGAIGSVRAPRANWCPGSVTPPVVLEPDSLQIPGAHSFQWALSRFVAGGSWRISATFFAYGPLPWARPPCPRGGPC